MTQILPIIQRFLAHVLRGKFPIQELVDYRIDTAKRFVKSLLE